MRNSLVVATTVLVVVGVLWWFWRQSGGPGEHIGNVGPKVVKSAAEWRELLTEQEYYVTRQKGTERAFTGRYHNTKTDGVYHCVCCGLPLFDSTTKYESGTGWPSFWQPVDAEHVSTLADHGGFTVRTEVVCSRCDAHLGHVFQDGPPPTGLRYCLNSAALKLVAR